MHARDQWLVALAVVDVVFLYRALFMRWCGKTLLCQAVRAPLYLAILMYKAAASSLALAFAASRTWTEASGCFWKAAGMLLVVGLVFHALCLRKEKKRSGKAFLTWKLSHPR